MCGTDQTKAAIEKLKGSRLPVFLWGAAEMAKVAEQLLEQNGVRHSGMVTDDAYRSAGHKTRSELIATYSEYYMVCANGAAFYKSEEENLSHWPGCRGIFVFPDIYEMETTESVTEKECRDYREGLEKVYTALSDQWSRDSMKAYLEEKITKDYRRIIPYVVTPQYFFQDAPWKLYQDEVLFDCGAYDGDSIRDFMAAVGNWQKIIACEPDPGNYQRLLKNIRKNGWKSIQAIQTGISARKAETRFSMTSDMCARISGEGDILIPVDSIDHILDGERASIIKMDIEGSEMEALEGAVNTIRQYRPLLMISAYHKKDDLIRIFEFMERNTQRYRYFFRLHRVILVDAVLYGIPEERLA